MKFNILMTAAVCALVAGSATQGFAQASPPSVEPMTADQVDPKAPFGEMKLDMTAPMGADMSAEDRAQLKARCDVIMANKDRYDLPTNTYCETNKDAMAN